jgi:eukaryotic-like serine/threonine-protein kinase
MSVPDSHAASDRAADNAEIDSRIGTVIDGRYRITGLLAMGGMGAVYEAEHKTLGKSVALKVILPEFAGNGEVRARFEREAMASSKLHHPNVVGSLDFGSLDDGCAYLVMERVPGYALSEMLEHGAISYRRAIHIATQIADALVAAHAEGIIHRDLKPDNVMLVPRDDGTDLVKVLDFGIARVSADDHKSTPGAGQLTQLGMIVGTPGYMSPEQALGERVDYRTDLYSLGVLLWEMIAGKSLFEGELSAIITRQLGAPPPTLREGSGDSTIPGALEELVARLLSSKAGARPESALVVRDALTQIQLRSSRPGDPTPLPFTLARMSLEDAASRVPASMNPLTRPWIVLVTVALSILAGGILVGIWLADTAARPTIPLDVGMPTSVLEAIEQVLHDEDRAVRKEAANLVLRHDPGTDVPPYARAVARLEIAQGCKPMTSAIVEIARLGDARALPALDRLAATPPTGCGNRKDKDCIGCLREPLTEAIERLRE